MEAFVLIWRMLGVCEQGYDMANAVPWKDFMCTCLTIMFRVFLSCCWGLCGSEVSTAVSTCHRAWISLLFDPAQPGGEWFEGCTW